jgi:DNA-binding transcriptional LysR family regulator
VLGLHKASFVVWFGAMTIHVLAYAVRAGRHLVTERARRVEGRTYRIAAAVLAVGAGLGVAFVAYPLASPWLHGLAQ